MTTSVEKLMARRNTRAFIDADPVAVVLKRPTVEETPAGGRRRGPLRDLPPQRVRLVPLSGNVWDRSKQKVNSGNLPDVTHQLIGMPKLDIQKDDVFSLGADDWVVTHVSPERTERTSANIVLRSQVEE